ncbi:MAG: rod-binding protein [Aureliella sp.]
MISNTTGASSFQGMLDAAPSANEQLGKRLERKSIEVQTADGQPAKPSEEGSDELKEAFQDFVGQTFFSEMMKALRSTQDEAAYMNGGRAEKVFQGQLDQVLTEQLSEASADKIAEPMYDLFMGKRSR